MDTTGAPSHDSGTTSIAPVIPLRPGFGAPPRREDRIGSVRCVRICRSAAEWLRSAETATARRWSAALLCATVLGLMWWDSRSEGYNGLPINTLGQVLGDLIMMGIALPLVLPRRPREASAECGLPAADLVNQLARATRRIQLLDAASTLFPEPAGAGDGSGPESGFGFASGFGPASGSGNGRRPGPGPVLASGRGSGRGFGSGSVSGLGYGAEPGPWLGPCPDEDALGRHAGSDHRAGHGVIARWLGRDQAADPQRDARAAVLNALRSALARDVAVEVLLPRPELMVPLDGLTGLPARTIEQDLADLRLDVPTGKLDVHHYRDTPGIVMARCDDQLWVSFPAPDACAGAYPRPAVVVADDDEDEDEPADTGLPASAGARRTPNRGTIRAVHLGSRGGGPAGAAERPVYMRFDCRSRNARVIVLHFARLLAAAESDRHPSSGSDPDRARPGADPEGPGGRFAFARPPQPGVRRTGSGPTTGPPRPRGPGAAEPPPRREAPSLLVVTAPPDDPAGAGRPEPGRRWCLSADRARTHPHRDGE